MFRASKTQPTRRDETYRKAVEKIKQNTTLPVMQIRRHEPPDETMAVMEAQLRNERVAFEQAVSGYTHDLQRFVTSESPAYIECWVSAPNHPQHLLYDRQHGLLLDITSHSDRLPRHIPIAIDREGLSGERHDDHGNTRTDWAAFPRFRTR